MSTQVLEPASDYSVGSGVSKTPSGDTCTQIFNSATDSDFVSFSSSDSNTTGDVWVTLGSIPGNVASITAATITVRALVSSTKSPSYIQARIYKSNGSTGLCSAISGAGGFTPTTSFSNLTVSCTGLDTTISDWSGAILFFSAQADGNGNTFEVSEAYVTLTVTLGSPPGAPTGLAAAYGSSTSVALSWTQGSGTVTDNEVQYQVAGAGSWTTIDIGSAATSYTVTGLTQGQLYFFQVNAGDSGDYSSYCTAVPWVCGSTLTLQVNASANDAFQNSSGAVTTADSTDSMTNFIGELLGFRFPDATIAGVPITHASLYLYFTTGGSGTIELSCEKSTSSAAFATSTDNLSNRTTTGATTAWMIGGLSAGWNASPDFSPSIVELINQPAWASGDTVTVLVANSPIECGLSVEMYDGNSAEAAVLAISTGPPPLWTGLVKTNAVQQAATW